MRDMNWSRCRRDLSRCADVVTRTAYVAGNAEIDGLPPAPKTFRSR